MYCAHVPENPKSEKKALIKGSYQGYKYSFLSFFWQFPTKQMRYVERFGILRVRDIQKAEFRVETSRFTTTLSLIRARISRHLAV